MAEEKIVKLFDDFISFIVCPECGYDKWTILVDQAGDFKKFTGVICPECNFYVKWEIDKEELLNTQPGMNQGSTDSENPTDLSQIEEED